MSLRLLPPTASETAERIDALFFVFLGVSGAVILLVAGLLIGFGVRYRREARADRTRLPKAFQRETEVAWTLATLLLFIFLFSWAAANAPVPPGAGRTPLDIYVIAKQWMWKAQHPDGARELDSLHLPAGEPVRLRLNSQDVIHSFYAPALRMKQDVVPGLTTELRFTPDRPGVYRLMCAEFCGTEHSAMTGEIVVMEPAAYADWLADRPQGDGLAEEGARIFRAAGCPGCHAAGGTVRAPDLRGLYGGPVALADGAVVAADEAYLRDSILRPKAAVVAGYAPVMPSFDGRLSEADLLRLIAFLKSYGEDRAPDAVGRAAP